MNNKMQTLMADTLVRFGRMLLLMLVALSSSFALAGEDVTYYHLDALGSPVAATDKDGNLKWREQYRPFGERIQKDPATRDNNRFYTGHVQDEETGLTYMGARFYDPIAGRFMAVDPVKYQEGNLHSFNRYAYANNNPYKYVDPDGKEALIINAGINVNVSFFGKTYISIGAKVGFGFSVENGKPDMGVLVTQLGGVGNDFSNVASNTARAAKLINFKAGPTADVTFTNGDIKDLEGTGYQTGGSVVIGGYTVENQHGDIVGGEISISQGSGMGVMRTETEVLSLHRLINQSFEYAENVIRHPN